MTRVSQDERDFLSSSSIGLKPLQPRMRPLGFLQLQLLLLLLLLASSDGGATPLATLVNNHSSVTGTPPQQHQEQQQLQESQHEQQSQQVQRQQKLLRESQQEEQPQQHQHQPQRHQQQQQPQQQQQQQQVLQHLQLLQPQQKIQQQKQHPFVQRSSTIEEIDDLIRKDSLDDRLITTNSLLRTGDVFVHTSGYNDYGVKGDDVTRDEIAGGSRRERDVRSPRIESSINNVASSLSDLPSSSAASAAGVILTASRRHDSTVHVIEFPFAIHTGVGHGGDFLAVELTEGHLRFVFDVGSGPRFVHHKMAQPINDNRWHEINILRPSVNQHIVRVDDSSPSVDTLPDSRSVHYDLSGTADRLYIGGVPRSVLGVMPRQVRSRDGYQGCLASVDLNGDCWKFADRRDDIPSEFRDEITDGCSPPKAVCSASTCRNGGICVQLWNTVMCNCDMTSYSGPTCFDESTAYSFGQLGGMITFRFADVERPDTKMDQLAAGFVTSQPDGLIVRITSATSNDFIEIELIDGAVCASYNMGIQTHTISSVDRKWNDEKYHVVKFVRHGQNSTLQIDNGPVVFKYPSGRQLTTFNHQASVIVGSKKDPTGSRLIRRFRGTIAGLVLNGLWILDLAVEGDERINIDGDVEVEMRSDRSEVTRCSPTTPDSVTVLPFSPSNISSQSIVTTSQIMPREWRTICSDDDEDCVNSSGRDPADYAGVRQDGRRSDDDQASRTKEESKYPSGGDVGAGGRIKDERTRMPSSERSKPRSTTTVSSFNTADDVTALKISRTFGLVDDRSTRRHSLPYSPATVPTATLAAQPHPDTDNQHRYAPTLPIFAITLPTERTSHMKHNASSSSSIAIRNIIDSSAAVVASEISGNVSTSNQHKSVLDDRTGASSKSSPASALGVTTNTLQGMHVGLIVGIVVAAVLVVAGLSCAIYKYRRRAEGTYSLEVADSCAYEVCASGTSGRATAIANGRGGGASGGAASTGASRGAGNAKGKGEGKAKRRLAREWYV